MTVMLPEYSVEPETPKFVSTLIDPVVTVNVLGFPVPCEFGRVYVMVLPLTLVVTGVLPTVSTVVPLPWL